MTTEETTHHELHAKLQLPATTDTAEFSLGNSLVVKASETELILLGISKSGYLNHYQFNRLSVDGKVQLNVEGSTASGRTQGPSAMHESKLIPGCVGTSFRKLPLACVQFTGASTVQAGNDLQGQTSRPIRRLLI